VHQRKALLQGALLGAAEPAAELQLDGGTADPDQWRYDLAAERAADLAAGRPTSRPVKDAARDFEGAAG
jgi:hypothetical protein